MISQHSDPSCCHVCVIMQRAPWKHGNNYTSGPLGTSCTHLFIYFLAVLTYFVQ